MAITRDETFPCARDSASELFIKSYTPDQVTKPTIVFLHDLFDYHGLYQNFAAQLAAQGYPVHLPDFPGFGRSGGGRGVIDRHDNLVDDIESYLRSLPGQVILGGHGFGALIAIRLLHRQSLPADKSLLGLILSNPLLRLSQGLPQAGRFIFERLKHPFDLVPLPWKLKTIDRCVKEAAAINIAEDPLVRDQLLLRTFRQTEKLIKLEQNASYLIDVPTLTMLSGSDTIGSIAYARLFTKAIDPEISVVKEYPQARRDLLIDHGHEETIKDVLVWLEERF